MASNRCSYIIHGKRIDPCKCPPLVFWTYKSSPDAMLTCAIRWVEALHPEVMVEALVLNKHSAMLFAHGAMPSVYVVSKED